MFCIFIFAIDLYEFIYIFMLTTWCKELIHWKRPWCWERLKAGGEGDGRGRDGCIHITDSMDVSLSKLQDVVKNRETWWTARHGVTKSERLNNKNNPDTSVQFSRSVVSDSFRPHESQHARPPCPSPTPGVHIHRVSDAIQPSHPLSSPSPPALNPSQSLFQWVNSSHEVAKVLEFQL